MENLNKIAAVAAALLGHKAPRLDMTPRPRVQQPTPLAGGGRRVWHPGSGTVRKFVDAQGRHVYTQQKSIPLEQRNAMTRAERRLVELARKRELKKAQRASKV